MAKRIPIMSAKTVKKTPNKKPVIVGKKANPSRSLKKTATQSSGQHYHSDSAHEAHTLDELFARMRSHDLKLTPPRKLILTVLFDHHGPFSAEDLYSRYTKKTCDLATVYRTLVSLEDAHILRRCEFGDGVARYELANPDHSHHHHLVCNQCKKIEIVDLSDLETTLEKMIESFAKKRGYTRVSHLLEFFGTCSNCQK